MPRTHRSVAPGRILGRRVFPEGRWSSLDTRILVAFVVAGLLASAAPAAPQTVSFGKNKIQYLDFQWRVLDSEHFDLYFYPEEEVLARTALRIAEEAYDGLAARFGHEVDRKIPLIIYSSHQDFEQTNVSPFFLPEGVAGFTEFMKGRVALPFNGNYFDFEHVIWHELVHVFQLSKLSDAYRLHYRNSFVSPPLWFTEGMAERWSGDWDSTGDLFLGDLVLGDMLPAIPDLWRYSGTFVIYKIGQDLVGFLEREYGPDIVRHIYDELWRSNSFEEALEEVTETPIRILTERWHHDLNRRYYPKVQEADPMPLAAAPLATKGGANFQAFVPPPDGVLDPDQYYFLSPRNGWMNLYRASMTGNEKDVEKVLKGQRRPEYESFHGFESRPSLSRDGILAFASKYHERDGLFLYDVTERSLVGRWQFEGLVSLRSPTFRPDGRAVVFAGLAYDGRHDIYLFDVDTETLRPLTDDRYYDDDPAWSPDGTTLAFVSDRTPWGEKGARNIFLLDMENGEVRPLTYGPWKDSDPSWSGDGNRLAYSSDREGTSQLYVADSTLASVRVTSLLGGATSPSWAADGSLLFTGMSRLRFSIQRTPVRARGDTLDAPILPETPLLASMQPAVDSPDPSEETALASSWTPSDSLSGDSYPLWPSWEWRVGGGDTVAVSEKKYRSRFTMDFAQGGVALEPTTGGVGEGLQALLTDQLGNQVILFQFANTASRFSEILGRFSIGLTYMNLKRRHNWGLSAFHFAGDFLDEVGRPFFERRVGGSLLYSYPYTKFTRLESSLSLLYSDRSADTFRPARAAPLAVNTLSLVHDTSLWFPTGPIDGERYNLTVGMSTNLQSVEVENVSFLVDLRKYFRIGLRSTYAVRLQGRVSEGSYPQRFVMGGSWSFRGYPRRSLVGSRSLLLNQEVRFPLLSGAAIGLPVGVMPLPPVQGAVFFDVGQAWEKAERGKDLLGSYGLGFRSSLGGFLVLRLDVSWLHDFHRVFRKGKVDFLVGFNY